MAPYLHGASHGGSMSKVVGEVIATPDGPSPFAAVIRSDTRQLMRVLVETQEQGERLVAELLQSFEESDPGDT
jgi:hypothetical protein